MSSATPPPPTPMNQNATPTAAAPINDGSCFVAGTLVNTPGGLRKIESLEVGDLVWDDHSHRLATVTMIETLLIYLIGVIALACGVCVGVMMGKKHE